MLNTAQKLNPDIFTESIKRISNRNGFGDGLVLAGKKDKNVVALTADLTESTKTKDFAKLFPERFVQVGVSEQNMTGIAAGLGLSGKIPFMTSYSVFSPGLNWGQIRHSICYSGANVKIVGSHGGLATGADGATHQGLEDIALMRVLPQMTVVAPADYHEAKKATLAAAEYKGPMYIRLCREDTPILTTEDTPFEPGKAQIWLGGEDITIISCGPIIYEVLLAAKRLKDNDIAAEIINCSTIKPLDEETILNSIKKTNKVLTIEDHQIIGGLGSAVSELLTERYPTKLKRMGIKDTFGESGTPEELRKKHKLTARDIVDAVLQFE